MVPGGRGLKKLRRMDMKKKVLAALMAVALTALTACGAAPAAPAASGSGDAAPAATDSSSGSGKKVAVAMPTQSSERWMHDGANMKAQLDIRITIDIVGAKKSQLTQNDQARNYIQDNYDVLCVNLVDRTDALSDPDKFDGIDVNDNGTTQYVMLEEEAGHQDSLVRTSVCTNTIVDAEYSLEKLGDEYANWDRDSRSRIR